MENGSTEGLKMVFQNDKIKIKKLILNMRVQKMVHLKNEKNIQESFLDNFFLKFANSSIFFLNYSNVFGILLFGYVHKAYIVKKILR